MSNKRSTQHKRKKQLPRKVGVLQRLFAFIRKGWVIAFSIMTIFGVVLGFLQWPQTIEYYYGKIFTSTHDKFHEQYYTEGDIKSPNFNPSLYTKPISVTYKISTDAPNFSLPLNYRNFPIIKGIPIGDLKKRPYLLYL